jgi:histidinol dehydrogenase
VLAQTAGVARICATSPKPSKEILACAHILGISEVYRVGGAQAIAAMAFGTESIARVDRIVGPGNAYVAVAKKLLAGEVGIDFLAGPTEILILAADGDARVIAADMLAQAEHDVSASAMLLTTSHQLAQQVSMELERQLATLTTAAVARESIDKESCILVFDDMDAAVACANRLYFRKSLTRERCFWVRIRQNRRAIMPLGRAMFFPPAALRGCAAACPRLTL